MMHRLWIVVFIVVVVVAVVFLAVGTLGTSHKLYKRFDKVTAAYEASDPVLIREMSFG